MAMNGNTMATEIIAAMDTLTNSEKLDQLKVIQKMCNAIVDHIKNNGVVSTTVATAIPVQVTPATGTGATTSTGTGSGTIA